MELVRTIDMGGFYIKKYKENYPIQAANFVQNLLNMDIGVSYVKVKESVESDMQSLDGERFTPTDFIEQFNRIKAQARDASYEMEIIYNDLPHYLTIADGSDTMAFTTAFEDLDLSEILQKKNKGLGL